MTFDSLQGHDTMNNRILFLLIVMTAMAVPAFAQVDHAQLREVDDGTGGSGGWYDVTYYGNGEYFDDPCTATIDWTWVSYDLYVQGEQKAAGFDRYLFDESTTVGGGYSASGTSFTDVTYAQPVEMRHYRKVNTYTNMHIVTVVRYDPALQYQTVHLETACGDGSPDSLQ
jgi:hypothetical protein